ncbi:MAG: ATP12 family chaperone protein [Paracoccaceae bacterium]
MKRFWSETAVVPVATGFAVRLDDRPLMTPARAPLDVPTRALADGIAAEWQAQGDRVDPLSMPLTRAANAAIDRVRPGQAEIAARIAEFGRSDLVCYRAPEPARLVARQAAAWDPLLDWAAERYGARLRLGEGVMFVTQDDGALDRLRNAVEAFDAWGLTALHDLVALSGSLVIGLAVAEGRIDAAEGWRAGRIDEDWNAEAWGEDAEAAADAADRRTAFLSAERLLGLLRRP